MIRYVVVLRRRADLTREQFLHVWLTEHLPMARALPGVRAVAFHAAARPDSDYDGMGTLDFDDLESLEASLVGSGALALRAHTATFADSEGSVRIVVEL
ncbi:MAG: EthD family reductase [Actinomycetes bacterium]